MMSWFWPGSTQPAQRGLKHDGAVTSGRREATSRAIDSCDDCLNEFMGEGVFRFRPEIPTL